MNINEELVRRITEAVVKQIQSPKEGQSGRPAVTGGERINAEKTSYLPTPGRKRGRTRRKL